MGTETIENRLVQILLQEIESRGKLSTLISLRLIEGRSKLSTLISLRLIEGSFNN